jgi:hypothetical protein
LNFERFVFGRAETRNSKPETRNCFSAFRLPGSSTWNFEPIKLHFFSGDMPQQQHGVSFFNS